MAKIKLELSKKGAKGSSSETTTFMKIYNRSILLTSITGGSSEQHHCKYKAVTSTCRSGSV